MDYLRQGVDWSKIEWSYLSPFNQSQFQWVYGVTPFSHLQVPIVASIIYLLSLFALQNYMQDKKPMTLRWITFAHNVILTILAFVMFTGVAYGAVLKYQAQGFWSGLVCEQEQNPIRGPLFYWSYIFYLSKYYELIDSFLIVLKKKDLIFLHVWHHFIMTYTGWAGLEGKWCMALWTSAFWNSFVHIWMYYYYSVSTLGYNPWWKKHLTGLQIYQFVSGVLYTAIYFYYYFQNFQVTFQKDSLLPTVHFNQGCTGELWSIMSMFFVNCSFLFLFSKFFVQNYLGKNKEKRRETINNNNNEKNIKRKSN